MNASDHVSPHFRPQRALCLSLAVALLLGACSVERASGVPREESAEVGANEAAPGVVADMASDTDEAMAEDAEAGDEREALEKRHLTTPEHRRLTELESCRLQSLTGRFIVSVFAERCPDFGLELRENVALALIEEATALDLDPMLLLGLIQVESRFDPEARSAVGARGLVQLRPATARHLADQAAIALSEEEILNDPEWQIRLGARYLAELRERFHRQEWMLMAYNAGPTKLQRLLSRRGSLAAYEGYPRAVFQEKRRFEAQRARFEERFGGRGIPTDCERDG